MPRRLDPFTVATVLDELGIAYVHDAEGFRLPDGWALRGGAGAAGRQFHWFLWHLPSNVTLDGPPASSRRALRWLLKRRFVRYARAGEHEPN